MIDEDVLELAEAFENAGRAHHQAFIESDGEDPDWPIWYAEFLHEDLSERLTADFTKSELIYLLVLAEKERSLNAPGSEWKMSYANFFLDRYS